ncbi:hypothetical protein GCM10025759_35050 [Lysobacter panacisoli]|uniref:Tetratricopeptide repeat protein n=2 Tax=Lysobacter panacisoli TaxID=1255263 RepID=A0ABP9LT70_9GAMM
MCFGMSGVAGAEETTAATAEETPNPQQQRLRDELDDAYELMAADKHAEAARRLSKLIDAPLFASLPPREQAVALTTAGDLVLADDVDRALDLYRRAVRADDSQPGSWYRLTTVELDTGHPEAAAAAFTEIVERWPQLLAKTPDRLLDALVWRPKWSSPERIALLQALFDANWSSKVGSDDDAWFALALARAEQKDLVRAASAIRRIKSAKLLIGLLSDKRFDSVVQGGTWTFDPGNAARREVEALRQQMQLSPDDMEVRVHLTRALLLTGEHEALLKLVDDTQAEIASAPADAPALSGADEAIWLMNSRSTALLRMGRTDEAVAELTRAASMPYRGQPNVNQALNLGGLYCSLQRPDDALRAIATVKDNMSPFGQTVRNFVTHCAAVQTGNKRVATKALAYLRTHRSENPEAFLRALLRDGRIDEAASQVRDMLASPESRTSVLMWVQQGLSPPQLPGDAVTASGRATLLARDDVRTAIDQVGRVEQWDLYLE